jgi:hypothetical protein
MSDNPGMHQQDEPSAAELDRVRALLAGLGEEPAPPAVVARLERVLESQLPAAGAVPRRRPRRWLPRAVVGGLGVAAIVAGALVVSRGGNDDGNRQSAAGSAASTAIEAASAFAATNAAPAQTAADAASPAASAAAPAAAQAPAPTDATKAKRVATPQELRQAALDAYRETRRLLLARRAP